MIRVTNLNKVYGTTTAIRDVTFEVEEGEILGFLGPNGAGKTTTMRILTGYTSSTSGSATVEDFDVRTNTLEVKKRIGYLPETVPLYPEMTVEGYLDFVAHVKGLPRDTRKHSVQKVIEDTELGPVHNRLCGNISRGFRQRVGIAQALVSDPPVLILDEPTVGLDPKQVVEIRTLIRSFHGKKTVILSTHILPEVSMTCSKVAIINEGSIVASGTPDNLMSHLQERSRINLTIQGPADEVSAKLASLADVQEVKIVNRMPDNVSDFVLFGSGDKDIRAAVSQAVHANGWTILEMHSVGLSLEDIFLRVVTGVSLKDE